MAAPDLGPVIAEWADGVRANSQDPDSVVCERCNCREASVDIAQGGIWISDSMRGSWMTDAQIVELLLWSDAHGLAIWATRLIRDITQATAAEQLGVHTNTVARWEREELGLSGAAQKLVEMWAQD